MIINSIKHVHLYAFSILKCVFIIQLIFKSLKLVFAFDVVNKMNNIVVPQNENSFKGRHLVARISSELSYFCCSWVPTIFKEVSIENWQIMNVPGMNMRSPKMMSGQSLSPYLSLSTFPTWIRHPQSWNISYFVRH